MVLEVQYPHEDTSFVSSRHHQVQFVMEDRDASLMSCRSNARDTSTSPRDTLEELRQSHNSILNLTEDGEESDDDDASQGSCLFEDLNEPPRLEDAPACDDDVKGVPKPVAACCPNERTKSNNVLVDWLDTSTNNLRNATESLAETLCPASMAEEPCGNFRRYVATRGKDETLQRQMELDILALLGYSDEPTDEELATWASPILCPADVVQPKARSSQQSIRSRVQRVHRFRRERELLSPKGFKKNKSFDSSILNETNATFESTNVSTETSFQDAFGSFLGYDDDLPIGLGLEPIQHSEQDGYDSDPGETSFRRGDNLDDDEDEGRDVFVDSLVDMSAISLDVETARPVMDISHAVQESLNYSWNLTWHPTKQNMDECGRNHKSKTCFEPMCIQLWFERGHMLHFGHTIIEPQFMWRSLAEKNALCATPFQMRLLNVCRAVPVVTIDRSKYPLARTSHSFMLRLVDGSEYVFEASSERERDEILQRWKLVVARLATLAVFEDVHAMQQEFFSPGMDPQTLTFSNV